MQCTCGAHAVHMRCTCGAHAVHMRCTCGAHAVHMRHGAMHKVGTARTSRMFTRAKARKARGVRYSLIAHSRSKPTPIMVM
eukprot:scaffold8612_cov66-Phaeocystis_antarctica.AAC.2